MEYSYTIDTDTRQCGIDPSFLAGGKSMVPWNVDNAKQAIQNFCTDTTDGFVVDPATPTPRATSFSQSRGPYPYQDYRYGANTTDHVTSIFVAFTQDAQACSPPTKFSISDYSDQCTKLLTQVLEDPDACELYSQIHAHLHNECVRLTCCC